MNNSDEAGGGPFQVILETINSVIELQAGLTGGIGSKKPDWTDDAVFTGLVQCLMFAKHKWHRTAGTGTVVPVRGARAFQQHLWGAPQRQ